MKILMMAPLPPPSGGIASWTVRYRNYCVTHRIPLDIVNIAMRGKRAISEVMQRHFMDELLRTWSIYRELKDKIKKDKPDVLHINTSCSPLGVFRDAMCVFSVHNKVPIILHCRCNIEDQLGTCFFSQCVFRYLVKKSTKVIVLNKFSREYVGRFAKNKACFIPNFLEENMIDNNHMVRDEISKVIYVGHVEKAKGLDQIVETAKQMPDIEFSLIGAVREDISVESLPSNVFIVGRVSTDEVQNYMKQADVFLFPSLSEGFSNAMVEAMGMGLPIIASNVGANSEMIEGKGGIILSDNKSEIIKDAIIFIKDKDTRKRMSDWNVEKVKNTYLIDSVMPKYMNLYKSVIHNTSK